MKVYVGIATHQGREETIKRTIESLKNQVDEIYLYDNTKEHINKTDNGKFYGLTLIQHPCYYFTCDSDIIYPVDYVERTISAIERNKTIVAYHGRRLKATGVNYYYGHSAYSFNNPLAQEFKIDVAGTGVCAFRTDYFNPTDLHKATDKRMSDLLFSLEALKQGKEITILAHEANWIRPQRIDPNQTIAYTHRNDCDRQNEIADEIIKLKLEKAANTI